jgi:hypothetical protein
MGDPHTDDLEQHLGYSDIRIMLSTYESQHAYALRERLSAALQNMGCTGVPEQVEAIGAADQGSDMGRMVLEVLALAFDKNYAHALRVGFPDEWLVCMGNLPYAPPGAADIVKKLVKRPAPTQPEKSDNALPRPWENYQTPVGQRRKERIGQ